MKTKIALLSLVAVAMSASVFAQEEIDDMYFTSKDRAAYNATRQVEVASLSKRVLETESAPIINPTDSYSARGVNPEYISGSKVGAVATTGANPSYFSANYQPTVVNQSLYNNTNVAYNGFGGPTGYNRFGSPYGMGMMGMGYSPWGYNSMSMMNPYMNSYMNPYMDPWMMNNYGGYGMNGFYQPGLTIGFGSGYGWGNSMFGNSFYNPWGYNSWGMNSFYGGWGNPYGYNNFYNRRYGFGNSYYGGNTVVIVDRPRAESARNAEVDRYYRTDGGSSTGGRVASQEYYNRSWRNDVQQNNGAAWNTRTTQSTNAWNSGWNNNNTNSGWNNNNGWNSNQNSGWGNSGGRSFSTGGGGGSSGGGSVGGGGGGSRRGRD